MTGRRPTAVAARWTAAATRAPLGVWTRWRAWTRRRRAVLAVSIGALLFVSGLILFATNQTQHLFRDTFDFEVSPGQIPRNDGGILAGAVLAGLGLGTVFLSVSRDPFRTVAVPWAGFVALFVGLLFFHFSIFVNGFIVPGQGVSVKGSFLFHDAATSLPIATFTLTLLTFLSVLGAALLVLRLVAPDVLRRHILKPDSVEAHRALIVLIALVFVAAGAGFLKQFTEYALSADASPEGDWLSVNLLIVYYLLALTLLGALVLAVWRTCLLAWGDLRDRRSRAFLRSYAYMTATENWLWGLVLLLNGIILSVKPVFTPTETVDRVFVMNSRGASMFFLVVVGLLIAHRLASRAFLRFLAQRNDGLPYAHRDNLLGLVALATAFWVVPLMLFVGTGLSPLARLAIRLGLVAMALPFFAVRFDLGRFEPPRLRSSGAPLVLLAAFAMSVSVGIMLWGVGNSVTTIYTASGGFVIAERNLLQPYATGIRFLGSFFLAIPLTIGLALLASRHTGTPNPWSLVVTGVSVIAAMNLLLTVNAGVEINTALRQREVLIGFAFVGAASAFDRALLLIAWSVVTALGFWAASLLLRKGAESPGNELAARAA